MLLLIAALMMLAAMAVELALMIGLLPPGLALALGGYVLFFSGMLVGTAGALRLAQRPR